jgi:hypothetical protein
LYEKKVERLKFFDGISEPGREKEFLEEEKKSWIKEN